ncbi:MAG: malonyl-CoA decarboxylase [Halocynthiibacter sp.]
MQRNSFLGDLLSTLIERRRSSAAGDDRRAIEELCAALLSAEGEISGLKLAAAIMSKYRSLGRGQKLKFFSFLNEQMDIEPVEIAKLARAYRKDQTTETFARLAHASESTRQELLRRLNQSPGATADLVAMRVDLLGLLAKHPELKRTDFDFVHLLRSWFNRGFLVLRQISWNTSATILEKIVAYEAVHAIRDWEDLRRRLHPSDRRCFAFFHPTMPDEPLIFVEVALTRSIPGSIQKVLAEDRETLDAEASKTAVFYSISNCQRGLSGISFGNMLVKQVVSELSQELPQLDTFVTLSPLPGFNGWLELQTDNPRARQTLARSAQPSDAQDLAARYLLDAKRPDGFPVDAVARFHLGNGAIIHEIHSGADTTENGLARSSGVMVNYLYDLPLTERNHEDYTAKKYVAASKAVRAQARSEIKASSAEN